MGRCDADVVGPAQLLRYKPLREHPHSHHSRDCAGIGVADRDGWNRQIRHRLSQRRWLGPDACRQGHQLHVPTRGIQQAHQASIHLQLVGRRLGGYLRRRPHRLSSSPAAGLRGGVYAPACRPLPSEPEQSVKLPPTPSARARLGRALALGLVLAGTLPCATASASRTQVTYFESSSELLNAATRPHAITQLEYLGVKAIRVELYWHEVAPGANSTN